MQVAIVLVGLSLHVAPEASGWSKGGLTFSAACGDSYQFVYGGSTLDSTPTKSKPSSCSSRSSRLPALGGYDEYTMHYGTDGDLFVRYFESMEAFVFGRAPRTAALQTSWPTFATSSVAPNSTGCIGWDEKYFFPGSMASGNLQQCSSGGPLVLFERVDGRAQNNKKAGAAGRLQQQQHSSLPRSSTTAAAVALSPLTHFSSAKIHNPVLDGGGFQLASVFRNQENTLPTENLREDTGGLLRPPRPLRRAVEATYP